ncbi:uncharacterized protein ACOB8E_020295 isoform 1-T1 [Sarcophilus harrisii]
MGRSRPSPPTSRPEHPGGSMEPRLLLLLWLGLGLSTRIRAIYFRPPGPELRIRPHNILPVGSAVTISCYTPLIADYFRLLRLDYMEDDIPGEEVPSIYPGHECHMYHPAIRPEHGARFLQQPPPGHNAHQGQGGRLGDRQVHLGRGNPHHLVRDQGRVGLPGLRDVHRGPAARANPAQPAAQPVRGVHVLRLQRHRPAPVVPPQQRGHPHRGRAEGRGSQGCSGDPRQPRAPGAASPAKPLGVGLPRPGRAPGGSWTPSPRPPTPLNKVPPKVPSVWSVCPGAPTRLAASASPAGQPHPQDPRGLAPLPHPTYPPPGRAASLPPFPPVAPSRAEGTVLPSPRTLS